LRAAVDFRIVACVGIEDVRGLRKSLGLSRAEFARFLGVSEATVVRWESEEAVTEPRGLQAVLLRVIADAAARHPSRDVARVLRSCGLDHRTALQTLLAAAAE
jgi:transcriptional regulator with XRE-family HTH domain